MNFKDLCTESEEVEILYKRYGIGGIRSTESEDVKILRKKYGIGDSRNTYTSEELIEISKQKLYYIRPYVDEDTGKIYIEHKQVYGYISKDESTCIWIKDKCVNAEKHYSPVQLIKYCKEIKKGIYHNEVDDIIYCTTDELEFCLNYEKEFIKKNIEIEIKELEKKILELKNTDIVFEQI